MSQPVVLNTRPREQAADLTHALSAAGLAVLEAPATEVQPAWEAGELRAVGLRARQGAYAWLVLQSQNAARFLARAVPDLDISQARVLCGASTARALGLSPADTLRAFSAAAALEHLRARVEPGQAVLVPRAADGREELVDGLRAMGVVVDAPVVYATRPVPPAVLRTAIGNLSRVQAIALCSPSAVHALRIAFAADALNACSLVCLGETTADAARQAGLRVDAVAQHTSMASLAATIAGLLEVPA